MNNVKAKKLHILNGDPYQRETSNCSRISSPSYIVQVNICVVACVPGESST